MLAIKLAKIIEDKQEEMNEFVMKKQAEIQELSKQLKEI